jgi:hypothetical protein
LNSQERTRSAVRVKALLLWAIFLGCWFALRVDEIPLRWQDAILAVAGIDAVLLYFIRCERCKDPLISLRPDRITSLWRIMLPQKRCPKCGMNRI